MSHDVETYTDNSVHTTQDDDDILGKSLTDKYRGVLAEYDIRKTEMSYEEVIENMRISRQYEPKTKDICKAFVMRYKDRHFREWPTVEEVARVICYLQNRPYNPNVRPEIGKAKREILGITRKKKLKGTTMKKKAHAIDTTDTVEILLFGEPKIIPLVQLKPGRHEYDCSEIKVGKKETEVVRKKGKSVRYVVKTDCFQLIVSIINDNPNIHNDDVKVAVYNFYKGKDKVSYALFPAARDYLRAQERDRLREKFGSKKSVIEAIADSDKEHETTVGLLREINRKLDILPGIDNKLLDFIKMMK